jgi:MFS family permease
VFSEAYKRYVLGVLTLVYTLNYLDRGLIILFLQPIKEDLHLSDTQLGFVTGIAFALFYATLGVPIARLADRGNRVTITSIAIALWGCTVMLCLFVTNFLQLVLARIAAAVGESGCTPPTYSLLGDYFPGAADRPRAMAVYWLASPVALLVSLILGGWLNERYGWRMTFVIMGIPALLVSVLVKKTIVEPRMRSSAPRVPTPPQPRMVDVLKGLWLQPSSRNLSLGYILLLTMALGLSPWYAAFMIRTHGMTTEELGLWLGLIFGFGGIASILSGGYIASRWLADNERAQMRLTSLTVVSLVPCFAAFLLLANKYHALIALIPLMIGLGLFVGPTFALMQRLVADEMRATTLAIVMLLANLIGMGIGPQVVGVLSDRLAPLQGADSLRYAMLAMSFVALWAAYHFWRAGETIQKDLAAVTDRVHSSAVAQATTEAPLVPRSAE